MIFLKLSFIFVVYNFLVGPMKALDSPPVYHYYHTTRFTMPKEWPHKQTGLTDKDAAPPSPQHHYYYHHPVTPTTLPQPAAFYVAPVAVSIFKPQNQPTSAPPSQAAIMPPQKKVYFKPALATTTFPNKLPPDIDDETSSNLAPLNPAPMLKPNPFTVKLLYNVAVGDRQISTEDFVIEKFVIEKFDCTNHQGHQIQFSTAAGSDGSASNSPSSVSNFNGPQRREEGAFCRRSFDGRSGYCILAYQCLHVIREYRVHGTKIDICTYRKNIPVICCPLADKHIDDQRISAQKCQDYHEAVRHIKLGMTRTLSGKMCVSSVPLIVGGEKTRKEEYPHMAALGWTQSDKEIKWGCGGTLISDLFVLTAAHCATSGGKPPDMVRLGTEKLNRTSEHQQDIKILIIILHPKYRSSSYYHDIALLKLTKRARFSATIQPACLWQLPDIEMPSAIATGWGRIEFMGPKSDELQKVNLNIIDQKTCKDIYRKERRLPLGIIDDQFCAGNLEGGKDTCQGDSGGPLHAELPEYNCVKFVIGITSFGKFCAAPNAPGVYTKIYSYLDWIEKIVYRA